MACHGASTSGLGNNIGGVACRPWRPALHTLGARACEFGRRCATVWEIWRDYCSWADFPASHRLHWEPDGTVNRCKGGAPRVTLWPLLSKQGTANNCTSLMLKRVSNPRSGAACFFSGALGSDFTPVHAWWNQSKQEIKYYSRPRFIFFRHNTHSQPLASSLNAVRRQ